MVMAEKGHAGSSGGRRRRPQRVDVAVLPADLAQLLVESMPDYAILLTDPAGRIVTWNSGAERITGYQRAEILGKSFATFFSPEDVRAGKPQDIQRRATAQGRVEDEGWRLRKDGSRYWADVVVNAVRDAHGQLLGFAGVTRDLTERRQAEAALRSSEESLARAQRMAHLANWERDVPTGRLWFSAEMYRILGMPPEAFGGTFAAYLSMIHPDDRERVKRALEATLAGNEPYSTEYRLVRPDGAVRVVQAAADVLYDAAGQPFRLVGTVQDITERKQLEDERERLLAREQAARAEAEAQRAWLSAVLDQLPGGVLLYDAGGHIRFNNQEALARSVGETGQVDPYGNPIIFDVRLPSGEPFPIAELPTYRTIARGERVEAFEMLLRQHDGRILTVRGRSGPVCGADGERLGTVAVFQDISALKELEREREEWISIITHDLRQPITIILGYAELLARQLGRAGTLEQRQAIDNALTAARNLNRMIGDLLDVSRIDTRRLSLQTQPVDLVALLWAIAERSREMIQGHPIRLTIRSELPPIAVDASRIEQVLDNLLTNAAKYSDPGTDIEVRIERSDAEVAIAVTNHGRGIAPEDLPRLFSRFYRTPEAQVGRVGGLGLGLYIAKGVVEGHGGRIWAESTPGQNTTFRFTLPLQAPAN
jgi:PAS domain S-box-containing protein